MEKKIVSWVVIIVVVFVALLLLDKKQDRKDCEAMALKASVETYPFEEYPNINQRTQLQKAYEQHYLESCN